MFTCTKCGLCCRNIGGIPELKDYDDGSGVCIKLDENNLCSIYSSRPAICNVKTMFELKYKALMTLEEFNELNAAGCRKLRGEMK